MIFFFLLLWNLVELSFANFDLCRDGYSCSATLLCEICPQGYFRKAQLSLGDACIENLPCIACSPGKFSEEGQAACYKNCPAGKYVKMAWRGCETCPSGFYTSTQTTSTSCNACPQGWFQTNEKALRCLPCPDGLGLRSPKGASKCETSCPPGHHLNTPNGIECRECPSGYIVETEGQQLSCTACYAGMHAASAQSKDCKPCTPGTFSSPGAANCTFCQPGKFSELDVTTCKDCRAGKYSQFHGASICNFCEAGKVSPTGAELCSSKCPRGTFKNFEQSSCDVCSPGKFTIPDNTAPECSLCEAGHFSESGKHCRLCPTGYFSFESSSKCSACPIGKFQKDFGANSSNASLRAYESSCRTCPRGYVSLIPASISCDGCPPGRIASAAATHCVLCPEGTIIRNQSCVACAAGRYQVTVTNVSGMCVNCPIGKYSAQKGVTICKSCGKGRFGEKEGSTASP